MIVEQIQNLCKQNNISLAQLERKLHFGNGTIRRWNESPPSITKVLEVAEFFNVNVDDLVKKKELAEVNELTVKNRTGHSQQLN